MQIKSLRPPLAVTDAIEVADNACCCDDKICLPRVVPAIAHRVAGDLDSARHALDDARRIRPQLGIDDVSRSARPTEIAGLTAAGLL